ncbi:MAG TPA: CHAT domain-containing protein [Gemmatimonas sp.]|nr:CHAT domain-containing protein [Gemmatimonas sp.]
MIEPVVIKVVSGGNGEELLLLLTGPREFNDGWMLTPLGAKPGDAPFNLLGTRPLEADVVRRCGQQLGDALNRNQAVSEMFGFIATANAEEEYPIYIEVGSPESENLPWEAIWRDQLEFLSLKRHWPIARLAATTNDVTPKERTVQPTLKILAVLAAAGVDATGEWMRLYDAVRRHGARVRVHVLVAQRELRAQIQGLGDPRFTAEWVGDTTSLMRRVQNFGPNLVHFFCHGLSEASPKLQLVQRSGKTEEISLHDLTGLAVPESIWLVTLNCCQGGRASGNVRSIARQLVARGVPAVVAMRESVESFDANLFTGAFYDVLTESIMQYLPSDPVAPDAEPTAMPESVWLRALQPSRQAIHEALRGDPPSKYLPADMVQWTLPMLYVRRGGLTLKPTALTHDADLEGQVNIHSELTQLRDARRQLTGLGMPAEALKLIDDKIADLEQQVQKVD